MSCVSGSFSQIDNVFITGQKNTRSTDRYEIYKQRICLLVLLFMLKEKIIDAITFTPENSQQTSYFLINIQLSSAYQTVEPRCLKKGTGLLFFTVYHHPVMWCTLLLVQQNRGPAVSYFCPPAIPPTHLTGRYL